MTSANAWRPRLVGRPRGIMPAPTASGVQAWGLLADLQGHEPNSTTAGSAHLPSEFIDSRVAASLPSFRPAGENARTITRRELAILLARRHGSRDPPAQTSPANFKSLRFAKHPSRFLFPSTPLGVSRRSDSRIPRESHQSHSRTVTGEWCVHAARHFARRIPRSRVNSQ